MNEENNFQSAPVNEPVAGGDNDKLWAALAYVFFVIPLLKSDRSSFVQFHTNQGLVFFIVAVAGYIVLSLIPFIGWIILPFFSIATLVFFVLGLMNSLSGKMKRLPLFGHLEILK